MKQTTKTGYPPVLKLFSVSGQSVSFLRRRYGHPSYGHVQFYCWAFLHIGTERYDIGDPWPAVNWPKKELQEEVERKLAELASVPA